MAKLLPRHVHHGLGILLAAVAVRCEFEFAGFGFEHAMDAGDYFSAAEMNTTNTSNETELLRAEIAALHKAIRNETLRIEAAHNATAEANATRAADEAEVQHINAQIANYTALAHQYRQEAADARAQIHALQHQEFNQTGPVVVWLSELPHQEAIAFLVGILGLLSVIGPSTFTRAFLAITGSAVGGLMVGACMNFFAGGPSWFGCVRSLLEGTGMQAGYWTWAVMLSLGLVRWLIGFNCALYACVDEVEIDGAGRITSCGGSLQKPLLDNEAPAAARDGSSSRPRAGRPGGASSSSNAVVRDEV